MLLVDLVGAFLHSTQVVTVIFPAHPVAVSSETSVSTVPEPL